LADPVPATRITINSLRMACSGHTHLPCSLLFRAAYELPFHDLIHTSDPQWSRGQPIRTWLGNSATRDTHVVSLQPRAGLALTLSSPPSPSLSPASPFHRCVRHLHQLRLNCRCLGESTARRINTDLFSTMYYATNSEVSIPSVEQLTMCMRVHTRSMPYTCMRGRFMFMTTLRT